MLRWHKLEALTFGEDAGDLDGLPSADILRIVVIEAARALAIDLDAFTQSNPPPLGILPLMP